MNGSRKIKTLNIVFTHWVFPTCEIRLKALKKIQRFCRRGSGNHAHSYMTEQVRIFGIFGPPLLYRQVANCIICDKIPFRIFKKYNRAHWCVEKLCENKDKNYREKIALNIFKSEKNQSFLYDDCFCNNKPFKVYKKMVDAPRGNFTPIDSIRYIMCELSGDKLTYYTRFKLSNYLVNRLR